MFATFTRSPVPSRGRAPRLLGTLLVVVLSLSSLGAVDSPAARYDRLGHQMMCICSCAQILIECNHVGCPDSSEMLAVLRTSVNRGDSDRTIFEAFQAKYGATALAAPMLTRFNAVAWVMPPAVLALGLMGAILLIRRWRLTRVEKAYVTASPKQNAMRERIRRETDL